MEVVNLRVERMSPLVDKEKAAEMLAKFGYSGAEEVRAEVAEHEDKKCYCDKCGEEIKRGACVALLPVV